MMDVFSIYRNPVPWEAIEVQLKQSAVCQNPFEKVFRHLLKLPIIKSFGKSRNLFSKRFLVVEDNYNQRTDRKRLMDLSLLESIQEEAGPLYYVHRLTAQYVLAGMEEAVRNKYHRQAGRYFEEIQNAAGKKSVEDYIESRWHYLQAGEWDQAAAITFSLEDYLTLHGFPQRSMELLRELEDKKLGDKNRAAAYHQMGNLFMGFCDYNEALKKYQKSLEISEKIKDIWGVSVSLHQIGRIFQEKGDYDAALIQYQKSLEIAEKIGDSKGVATNLHQIGMIYQKIGDYDAGLAQYQKSLEIREKIGDIHGVSDSLHQIGRICEEKGDYDAAFPQYQQSLEIFERIGDIKSKAISLHQIGTIYQEKGDYGASLTQYQKSLEIFEKIGDIAGVATSVAQMGSLYANQNQFETALNFFLRAFKIFDKIGSPYANKMKKNISKCRKKMSEERFQAMLKELEIDPKVFDPEDDETYMKMAMQFFSGITAQAVATSKPETSPEEIEETRTQLTQWIDDVKNDPHQEPVKNYFQFLLAYVNKEDYHPLLETIPPELKEIFENCLNHDL